MEGPSSLLMLLPEVSSDTPADTFDNVCVEHPGPFFGFQSVSFCSECIVGFLVGSDGVYVHTCTCNQQCVTGGRGSGPRCCQGASCRALGQQVSVSRPPQRPPGTRLHSVACSGLAQMPACAQMFSSAFGTHSFPRSFLLYSLPIGKGYLDPLGYVRSSNTPAAQSTHRKWVLACACQNSTAEPWGHRAGPGSVATRGPLHS